MGISQEVIDARQRALSCVPDSGSPMSLAQEDRRVLTREVDRLMEELHDAKSAIPE